MNSENIEQILKRLGAENIPADVHKIAEQTTEQFSRTLPTSRQHILWENIIKSPITKLAAAAMIIIAVILGLHHFASSIEVATPAFADVLEQIYKARTVIYKKTFYPGTDREFTTKEIRMEPGFLRVELAHKPGSPKIYDLSSGRDILLLPSSKKATITQRVGQNRGKRLFNYLEWFRTLHEESGEFISREEIDGKLADVFVVEEEFKKITIWIDPETNLPVRIERVQIPNPNKNIVLPHMNLALRDFGGDSNETWDMSWTDSGGGIQPERRTVLSDFVWNAELDTSLFSLQPPEAYRVEKRQIDASEPDEKSLIDAFAFWTEMSEGLFPSAINDLGDPNKVRPMLVEKFDRDGDPKEELRQAYKVMEGVLKGLAFAQQRKVDGSWYYAGDGVQLGEADKPICWWAVEDSNAYRVIYGDLSVGDSNEMPEL